MREGRNREGKARSTRKQSSKQSPEISNEDTEDGTSVVNTTTAQTEVPMKRENDQWDEETIQRAMNVWRKSPSGTAYHQQFNNDALNQNVEARAQRLTIQTQRLLERSGEGAGHVSPVTSPDAEHNLARTRSNPIIHHPDVSPVNTEAHYPYGANRYKPSTSTQQAATPRRSLSFAATSMFRTGDENWIGSQQSAYPYPEDDSVYPPRTLEWNENSDYQSRAPVPSASASQDGMTAASRGMPHHRYHPYPMPTSASYTHEYTQQGPSSVLQNNYPVPENDGGSQFESKYPNVHPFNPGF
ncbi:hypothetical protein CPB86DRAFT_128273 [Serendipita vermifera]|nr:hypothetical protein CPB86DRAFT_128273 [Serendipita vermifera]